MIHMRHSALGFVLVFAAASVMLVRAQDSGDLAAGAASVRQALRLARFDDARVEAERLKAAAPADAEMLSLYGDTLWASGLFDQAEQVYGDALDRAPQSSRARYGVARSLATRSRLSEALDQTLAATAAAPDDPETYALAGMLYERMQRFGDAADAYEDYVARLIDADPTAIDTARSRVKFLRSFERRVPLRLAPQDAGQLHTVPFKLVKNKIVLPGRVNGARVDWVLDTGAERTGISRETALRAGVRPVTTTLTAGVGIQRLRRIELARLDTVEIGSLKIGNVPASIRNPVAGGAPRWQGESLSPVALGLSAIVDYRQHEVIFGRELPLEPADDRGEVRLPMRVQRLPFVRGVINATHPAYFVVDTGGELISIGVDTADALDVHPVRRIPLRVFGLSGLDAGAFLLPGIDLDFQQIGYRKVGLAVLDLRAPSVLLGFRVGGIVGHKFLGEYRVAIDVARSELRLER
jgi:hypothetical protein